MDGKRERQREKDGEDEALLGAVGCETGPFTGIETLSHCASALSPGQRAAAGRPLAPS